ncbi:MAG: NifU family protein [Firmicutes bacterium]|nr:NifU family protein [Bacillota bacterium]MDD7602623.1 NifU family protein [Bacillota bacterium]MDY5857169.1 NifU family protein [Anaerovoracaceae bacterium]
MSSSTAETEKEIQKIIDEVINVQLALHGGSASLTAFEDGVAWVKFHGACASCMSSSDTLEVVVKEAILQKLPEVKDVQLDMTVSEDLLDMARKILSGGLSREEK